jgi:hypothetical protein
MYSDAIELQRTTDALALIQKVRDLGYYFDDLNMSAIALPYPAGSAHDCLPHLLEQVNLPHLRSTVICIPDSDLVILWIDRGPTDEEINSLAVHPDDDDFITTEWQLSLYRDIQ